jgi:hypothetical protein
MTNRIPLYLAGVLGLVSVAGGLYSRFHTPPVASLSFPTSQSPSPINTVAPTPTPVSIENWKTFTGNNYKYSLKLPDPWYQLSDVGKDNDIYSTQANIGNPLKLQSGNFILIVNAVAESSLDNNWKTYYTDYFAAPPGEYATAAGTLITKIGDLTINGDPAIKDYSSPESTQAKIYTTGYIIKHKSVYYGLGFSSLIKTDLSANSSLFDEIIRTIKFSN